MSLRDFNYKGLEQYDLKNAKVGDSVVIATRNRWSESWSILFRTVKNVTAKRGDVVFDDVKNTRYSKDGYLIGDPNRTHSLFFPAEGETLDRVKEFNEIQKCLSNTGEILKELSSVGGYALSQKLNKKQLFEFNELLKKFFKENKD